MGVGCGVWGLVVGFCGLGRTRSTGLGQWSRETRLLGVRESVKRCRVKRASLVGSQRGNVCWSHFGDSQHGHASVQGQLSDVRQLSVLCRVMAGWTGQRASPQTIRKLTRAQKSTAKVNNSTFRSRCSPSRPRRRGHLWNAST